MSSAARCPACVDGAKRKCTCGSKLEQRKRLKYIDVRNSWGEPLGFAAAASAAAAAQRAWPSAWTDGAIASAGAASTRGEGTSGATGVVDAWGAATLGGGASPPRGAGVQPAGHGAPGSAATVSGAGVTVAAAVAASSRGGGSSGPTGVLDDATGAAAGGGGGSPRCGSAAQAAGGGALGLAATANGAGGVLALGGAGATVTATAWARDASLRATHSLCTQCNHASPRGVSHCANTSCQAPMVGQVGEAYKATQARREEYVFTSVRGRGLRYMQGREQETESLCAGRGARAHMCTRARARVRAPHGRTAASGSLAPPRMGGHRTRGV